MDTQNMRDLVNGRLEADRRDAANRRLVGRTRERHGAQIRKPRMTWFTGLRHAGPTPKPTTA
jgi:hypothetical protein